MTNEEKFKEVYNELWSNALKEFTLAYSRAHTDSLVNGTGFLKVAQDGTVEHCPLDEAVSLTKFINSVLKK